MDTKEITDLGLIAGLMSKGYSPLERRPDGKRVIFVFETDEILEGLCNDYFNNRMDVDANTFNRTLRGVKQAIFQMQGGK